MTKSTMGTKLPRKLEQKMQTVGEQIRLARLRRNLSIAQVAERATCSPLTISRIEKGVPTVAIGNEKEHPKKNKELKDSMYLLILIGRKNQD